MTILIAGEAGQGIQTIGTVLCRILKRHGWNLFADQDYMSRIRGGNNSFRIRIGDTPCFAPREKTGIDGMPPLNQHEIDTTDIGTISAEYA